MKLRPVVIFMLIAIAPVHFLSEAILDEIALHDSVATWGVDKEWNGPARLFFRASTGDRLVSIDCVGGSASVPLLDGARNYNLSLQLHSEKASAWMRGRSLEVVGRLPDLDASRHLEVIGMGSSLLVQPVDTEWLMSQFHASQRMSFILTEQSEDLSSQEEITLSYSGFPDAYHEFNRACMRHYGP